MSNYFVTDDMVETALAYLSQDPHPCAVAKAEMVAAENLRKRTYSKLFLASNRKTVAEREAEAETHHEYEAAQINEAEKIKIYEGEKQRVVWADTITQLWRTVQSNNRAAERVR
jgi:ABC-type hemin transport system ATPase subunit